MWRHDRHNKCYAKNCGVRKRGNGRWTWAVVPGDGAGGQVLEPEATVKLYEW